MCKLCTRGLHSHTHALNKLPRASRNYEPNNPPCEDRESLTVCCDAECSLKFALRLLRSFGIISEFQFENELQFCDVRLTKETEIILTGTDSVTSSTGSFRIVGIKCIVYIKHCLAITARIVET